MADGTDEARVLTVLTVGAPGLAPLQRIRSGAVGTGLAEPTVAATLTLAPTARIVVPAGLPAGIEELMKLRNRTRDLFEVLDDRKRKGSAISQEFKIDFANALADVFERYFPNAQPSRGGYDRTQNPSSEYQAFLTACAQEVFGDGFKFSGNVLDEVAKLRGNR
ncbi:hypothetical protein ACFOM8_18145 [Paracoccus angustae]|uniref:Uncharacterized protein n=1 Tax=Paracoccus angustae TaxID=1671480 RepID=A0ABV7U8Y7_9RHOB